jgi:hypothetical protein
MFKTIAARVIAAIVIVALTYAFKDMENVAEIIRLALVLSA